jgi:hypothetical protein
MTFFRLPGDGGKRKPSALPGLLFMIIYPLSTCAFIPAPQGSVLFAHRGLPMGKKRKTSVPSVALW